MSADPRERWYGGMAAGGVIRNPAPLGSVEAPCSHYSSRLVLMREVAGDGIRVLLHVSSACPGPEPDGECDQRIEIDLNAKCESSGALLGLCELLGEFKPGVVFSRQVVRIGDRLANALVFEPIDDRDAENLTHDAPTGRHPVRRDRAGLVKLLRERLAQRRRG